MMLDKIGIIGNTQGVNESNNPATKKPAMMSHKLPDFKICVVLSTSLLAVKLLATLLTELVLASAAFAGKLSVNVCLMGA
jgi:hypothetical protein